MLIRKLQDCMEFTAGDDTLLRETLHAAKDAVDLGYSLAHATLAPGRRSYTHSLKSSEVYYVLSGEGVMHIDGEVERIGPGDTVCIPPGAKQYVESAGDNDLKFLCIVEPAWRAEDEVVWTESAGDTGSADG